MLTLPIPPLPIPSWPKVTTKEAELGTEGDQVPAGSGDGAEPGGVGTSAVGLSQEGAEYLFSQSYRNLGFLHKSAFIFGPLRLRRWGHSKTEPNEAHAARGNRTLTMLDKQGLVNMKWGLNMRKSSLETELD
jgi:hypothetical protein